jgi:hypothetical protein
MSNETPTVVLVHGAFADSSSWNGVIERLQTKGVEVTAPANPLRGIAHDSAYTAGLFAQTPGQILAVGHSYGGAVITAGTDVIRSQAERARATITEVEGSHVIMVSQPQAVTDVILEALDAVKNPVAVG